MLTALAGLFVSNCDEDIKVELSALEAGWEIKGSKLTVGENVLFVFEKKIKLELFVDKQ